jgi:hypothetical protein
MIARPATLVAAVALSAALAIIATGISHAKPSHVRRASAALEYGCPILPAEDPLNQEIVDAPVNPSSAEYVASIGLSAHLHPDFGTNPSYGIPYAVVSPQQPKVPIKLTAYKAESDPGPYPVPPHAPIEGGGKNGHGDKHVLVVQEGSCMLYELYDAHRKGAGWTAASGAVFNLRSDALRPRAAGDRARDAGRLHPPCDTLRLEQL